jgi:crossover junction endodeoxyribonuclease RusA
MGKDLYLVSPIPPSVNHYLGHRAVNIKGKTTAMVYETAEAKKYKKELVQYVLEQIKAQDWELIPNKTQHFYIDCCFYFGRTDMDPNNYFKVPLDAITETQAIWIDDNVTLERVQRIYYDKTNPRLEMHIHPVEYIGVFDKPEWLTQFTGNCKGCMRWKDGKCSILRESIEGRIREEVSRQETLDEQANPFVCSSYKVKKDKGQ